MITIYTYLLSLTKQKKRVYIDLDLEYINNNISLSRSGITHIYSNKITLFYRNPTPEVTLDTPVKWKPVHTPALEYLHIGKSNEIYMSRELFPERVKFWSNLMASIRDIKGVAYDYRPIKDEL